MSKHKMAVVREAVGIFHNADSLKGALQDLLASGFKADEIGLLASEQVVERSLGDVFVRTGRGKADVIPTNETPDSPRAPAIAFVRRESLGETARTHTSSLFFVGTSGAMGAIVASSALFGGALLAAVGGVVGVGIVGLLVATFIHQSDAEYLQQQIDEGHILLFVRTDPGTEQQVMNILRHHSGLDVKMYEVPGESAHPDATAPKVVNS